MKSLKLFLCLCSLFFTVFVHSSTNVQMYGSAGMLADTKKGTVKIMIDTIENFSKNKVSGDLRISIYFSENEFDGEKMEGQIFAAFNLAPLNPGSKYVNIQDEIPFAELPEGKYYKTICLEEKSGEDHQIINYLKFSNPDELNYPKLEFNSLELANKSNVKRNVYSLILDKTIKPGELTKFKNLTILKVKSKECICLDNIVDAGSSLKKLEIKLRNLEDVPECITALPLLQELDISSTPVVNLPETIHKLCNLRVLNLSNTLINHLPENISKLKLLKEVYLDNTEINTISPLSGSYGIEHLSIAGTKIDKFPEEIFAMKELKVLCLRNTKISKLPKDISVLSKLEILDLSYTNVESISKSTLEKLKSLKELKMEHCHVSPKDVEKIKNALPVDCTLII